MLIWNPGKLTKDGKALLAKAQAGKCAIQITKAQSGSGSYTSSEDISQRTALKTVKQTFPISNKVINTDSALVLKITMENSTLTAGYDITEFGVFASDPDKGEILYSIATASTSDYMPAYNGVVPSVINMSYYLEVANASTVTIKSAGALALQSDLEALEARVTAVESDALRGYGARRKVGASSTTWERVGAAIGLVAKAAVGNGTVQNDFMASVYPYNSVKPCNVAEDMSVNAYLGDADFQWDGSNGDVMLEVPQVYTARYFETDSDGVKWEYRWVAAGPVGRCHLDHAFTDGDRQSEKIYIPIFPGSLNTEGTKLESKAGVFPAHNKTRAQFRTLCTAKGDKWCLDDVWTMHLLDTLFIVMFASTNAQSILGAGRTEFPEDGTKGLALQERTGNYITVEKTYGNRFAVGQGISIGAGLWSQSLAADRRVTKIEDSSEVENAVCVYFDGDPVAIKTTSVLWSSLQPTGATIDMASPNGRIEGKTNGMSAIRFLYIEDWFGNMWQFRDGDNIKKWQHYYCNKRSSYADKVYDGDYFKVGYEAAKANGYVKEFGYDPEWPEIEICTDATGSSNTYFPDYYYQDEGGELVLSGAGVNNGSNAGPFYRNCNNGSGNSNWNIGGRPLCQYLVNLDTFLNIWYKCIVTLHSVLRYGTGRKFCPCPLAKMEAVNGIGQYLAWKTDEADKEIGETISKCNYRN